VDSYTYVYRVVTDSNLKKFYFHHLVCKVLYGKEGLKKKELSWYNPNKVYSSDLQFDENVFTKHNLRLLSRDIEVPIQLFTFQNEELVEFYEFD